ncbi:U32 family peptidase [Clostridium sp. CM028]|uniref:peptidase U32 family protein n=1 Tax=Clostridium sp. CM028 TaxID=2851575 RepID=UPI001C6EC377|nr:U32 family peptidase [Clostridium sp. CM028]MBW9149500.1 U32 family peptidase [Clostridium sp. CM028]WLC62147.1 U32 family peptidase [Clostridium sp. CM028]
MSRFFNNNEIELLAPAGTFEIFEKVIHSGADAVYLGGKKLNMRMHRKDYNLSNDELEKAINIAHSLNKKVYVTVNNLFSQQDLKDAVEYLKFLEKAGPDALIIQDFSILELINSLNLNLTIHSSVMMNVHNLETIKALRGCGITRIVASRDMNLQTIKNLHYQTDMEFEYFAHGDMCIAHGAQCLYSGMLFGKSSNRGLCMKPCRWNFTMKQDGLAYPTEYPMAVKDMYMYEHLPEMIEAGILSFKIEGRMKDADYLVTMINYYSDAINRYIDDPICYDRKKDAQSIYGTRIRDLSTCSAFGNPGLSNINRRYEGTGKFYSHGKVFSKPVEEIEISKETVEQIKTLLNEKTSLAQKPNLSVKVNSYSQAKVAIEVGVDAIYLSGEVFAPNLPFSKSEILKLTNGKGNTKIYLGFPKMMFEEDFSKYNHLLVKNNLGLDGLLVTNLGAIHKYKSLGLELIGDYSLNIYNQYAASFYEKQGLSVATLSVETPLLDAKQTIAKSPIPIEIIVHGSPTVMYMDHNLYENTKVLESVICENNSHVDNKVLVLVDEKKHEHPIYQDNYGRNHMMLYKELCYLPFLKELNDIGVTHFRIEACHYDTNNLRKVLSIYREAINDLSKCEELFHSLSPSDAGFTLGAFQFNNEGGYNNV